MACRTKKQISLSWGVKKISTDTIWRASDPSSSWRRPQRRSRRWQQHQETSASRKPVGPTVASTSPVCWNALVECVQHCIKDSVHITSQLGSGNSSIQEKVRLFPWQLTHSYSPYNRCTIQLRKDLLKSIKPTWIHFISFHYKSFKILHFQPNMRDYFHKIFYKENLIYQTKKVYLLWKLTCGNRISLGYNLFSITPICYFPLANLLDQ